MLDVKNSHSLQRLETRVTNIDNVWSIDTEKEGQAKHSKAQVLKDRI